MLGTPIWPNMRVPGPRLKNPSAIPVKCYYCPGDFSSEKDCLRMTQTDISTNGAKPSSESRMTFDFRL